MKITAGFWLLVWFGTFTHPLAGSAQERQQIKQGRGRRRKRNRQRRTDSAGTDSAGGGLYGLYPTARQAAG